MVGIVVEGTEVSITVDVPHADNSNIQIAIKNVLVCVILSLPGK
jgi:hypothetical protein